MDKAALQLLELLREMLAGHERLLTLSHLRQDAMRAFEVDALNASVERERLQLATMEPLERRRRALLSQFRSLLGPGAPLTVSEIAARCEEPLKTQLVVISGKLRTVVEELERNNRINSKVSQAVITSIAKVLKIITGVAQHAGLYMANGRKASLKGIHLLDAVG